MPSEKLRGGEEVEKKIIIANFNIEILKNKKKLIAMQRESCKYIHR